MIRAIRRLIQNLIEKGEISESEQELYQYAIECFLSLCAPFFLSIVIGIILGELLESILIIIPFACIRKFSGGYHARNSKTCFVASVVIIFLFIRITAYICVDIVLIIALVSTIGIVQFSPVDSENRRLDNDEKTKYKRDTCFLLLLAWGIIISFIFLSFVNWAKYYSMGIILTFCLQIPVELKKCINKSKYKWM